LITIRINKKQFKGAYSWNDITLQKFHELASIPMPDGYEAYILADGNYNEQTKDKYIDTVLSLTDEQVTTTFPAYYRRVVSCLSNIPHDLLPDDKVNELYEYYFKPFVLSLVYHAPVIHFMGQVVQYQPEEIKSFRIGLSRYYLPKTVNIQGRDFPLEDEPVLSYSDVSDGSAGFKLSKDDMNRLTLFLAIYCRKKNEVYDLKRSLERQSLMMKCKMSVVWSVFFCTIRRLNSYKLCTQLFGSLPHQITEVRDQLRQSIMT
jgi:hypothetical protein